MGNLESNVPVTSGPAIAAEMGHKLSKPPLLLDAGKTLWLSWPDIQSWSQDSITWQAPSSFFLYSDGSWALAVEYLHNGYDSYGPLERHFSVRWWWFVQYFNAQGGVIYQAQYEAGAEGYQGRSNNILKTGIDGGVLGWKEQIVEARGNIGRAQFY